MFSGILKFILGIFLAIAVLLGSGVAVALYFMNRTAIPPTKPIYANDSPALKDPNIKQTKAEPTPTSPAKPETSPTPTPTPSASPTETAEPLPPGTYRGRITWPQGVSLRSEPTQDSQRVGGAGFNENIIVLEENQDKVWIKIRVESTKLEGWTKIGNIQRVDE
ncbi:SH3 domain-containing protein [Anabaena subtropica]|uniref:SH3 domain-containing protein n=1 Tax=Anabaena subtropica FACHB-260 TaxID=2692884 RepID=A0ABR8CPE8_9NOST|nr:SH3 domain-containing protein [Anabaena subtropica]MBD2345067.1 SH3 domain-containing protein [Anabaena subtropica FACHB-260]